LNSFRGVKSVALFVLTVVIFDFSEMTGKKGIKNKLSHKKVLNFEVVKLEPCELQ